MKLKYYILTLIIMVLTIGSLKAQKQEFELTIPYNSNWQICHSQIAQYFRNGKLVIDKFTYFTGEVIDTYKNGAVQMRGVYDESGMKQGLFTYYYPDGKIEREGHFENDDMKGLWSFYNSSGELILKAKCETSRDFTPLFYRNKKGATLISEGNGKFELDPQEYPKVIANTSFFKIRSLEGELINGKREGQWKYYTLDAPLSKNSKVKKLFYDDTFKDDKFLYGKSYGMYDNGRKYVKPENPLSLYPLKDLPISKFLADYAFGDYIASQKTLSDFLFKNAEPFRTAESFFYGNNMKEYESAVRAAMNLSGDFQIESIPEKYYNKDYWVFFNNVTLMNSNDTIPVSSETEIDFLLLKDGAIKDVSVKSELPEEVTKAMKYYFSHLKKLSPMPYADSVSIQLRLSVEHKMGFLNGEKAYTSYVILRDRKNDQSYRNYLVKDSVVLTRKAPTFAGKVTWDTFLQTSIKKYANTISKGSGQGGSKFIFINYVIDEQGNVVDVKNDIEHMKGASEFSEVCENIIKNSPKWIPAELNGKKIRYEMRQAFHLD
ncbi:toxin-antitoxin system YwqK family antitoxin [Pedobacter heparinus]|uniref:TonB C-terminal domain-containing protein n=1 Tax=Pedobacter heparinus (strain ATCC 13125 / DSM 2366 / CIP 104194 / JCM 7457 / NBRC 12017 / NCIMB 9290 / NRRL B-14731 / HIM 762-3) TaxID=485917 RepID=C6Y2X7_PEDHD|nr:hypothetical protein [Pedobacter heparinus]ACU03190.1 hypothetical protein Phep_0968 [Pedobacter heparinus DSM 2366]